MRVRRLAVPALALVALWVVAGAVLSVLFRGGWIRNTVLLVISPLWFIAVYLMLVLLLPVALWLHRRFDTIVLVVLAGAAGAVDIIRFRGGYGWLGALNMIIVWGLCHQLGFFYERIVAARRTVDWTLLLGGLFALAGLVGSGLYPGSMVGVPGELSNMAPPTLCIVALVLFQAGAAEILRPSIEVRLARPGGARSTTSSTGSPSRCSCSTPRGWPSAGLSTTPSPGRPTRPRHRRSVGGSTGRWRSSARWCSPCR